MTTTDLDRSGPAKNSGRVYLGPSLGWTEAPMNILSIIAGGTTNVDRNVTDILVDFNGLVTIQLPSSANINPNLGTLTNLPITITDSGGFALANPITILPKGAETISSLASIQITNNFGSFTLDPLAAGGWTVR